MVRAAKSYQMKVCDKCKGVGMGKGWICSNCDGNGKISIYPPRAPYKEYEYSSIHESYATAR